MPKSTAGAVVLATAIVHASCTHVLTLRETLRLFVAPAMQRLGAIETGAQCIAVLRAAALLTADCTSPAIAPA